MYCVVRTQTRPKSGKFPNADRRRFPLQFHQTPASREKRGARQQSTTYLARVNIRFVRLRGRIELVPPFHHWIDDFLEQRKAILISTSDTNAKVRPQHSRLNCVRQGVPLARFHVLVFREQLRGENLRSSLRREKVSNRDRGTRSAPIQGKESQKHLGAKSIRNRSTLNSPKARE